jgi:hypothetical protein
MTTGYSYRITSWSDTSIKVDMTMPPEAVGLWQLSIRRIGWISDYDATHPSKGKWQVYDATPVISGVSPSTIPGGQSALVSITGSGFGNALGAVRVCNWTNWPSAFPMGAGTCAQSPDWTVGQISLWGAVINVLLTPSPSASGHYCVQVTKTGQNGNPFSPAPNAESTADGNCQEIGETPVCGTPTVTIWPRPIKLDGSTGNSAPFYATLNAQGAPNGLYYNWSTDNPSMVEFDDPHSNTVRVKIKGSGKAKISVDAENLCTNHATDSLTLVVSDDITVISWIDADKISLQGDPSAVVSGWLSDPVQCHLATLTWAAAGAVRALVAPPYDVGAASDIRYINSFMYKYSADPPPPQRLSDQERDRIHSNTALFRGFSRFQAYYEVDPNFNNAIATTFGMLRHDADVGDTPDFCSGGYPSIGGEPNTLNRTSGGRPDYVWWLNEFRVGTVGQNVNAYLNKRGQDPYAAMPWVWAVIQLDKNGKVLPLVQGTQGTAQIFPSYWVYSYDVLTQVVSQLGIETLIALDGTSAYHQ